MNGSEQAFRTDRLRAAASPDPYDGEGLVLPHEVAELCEHALALADWFRRNCPFASVFAAFESWNALEQPSRSASLDERTKRP